MIVRPHLIALLALAFAVVANAEETQAWRKPDGGLYFGIAPPPGSVRIEPPGKRTPSPRPESPAEKRPAAPPTTAPAEHPTVERPARPTATSPPAPRPTRVPPTATPTESPAPTIRPAPMRLPHREPTATPRSVAGGSACGDYVAIRDTRATIDVETDRVKMVGDVMVAGAAVERLSVCMGENCVLIADGKTMANGESARFSVSAQGRPGAFTVKCQVVH